MNFKLVNMGSVMPKSKKAIFEKKDMKKKLSYLVLFALLILPTVMHAQLNCYSLQAPEFTVDGMEKIAIMNFTNRNDVNWRYGNTNDHGSQLSDYMIGLLLEEHRGVYTQEKNKANKAGLEDLTVKKMMAQKKAKKFAKGTNFMDRYRTNVYTIVERGELDKIMSEQSLGASGAISDADATQVGKLLGLDVIISGGYSSDVNTSVKNNSSSSKGSYTAKKKANVDVTMKIISIETGQILSMINKTASVKRTATASTYSGASGSLPSNDQLIRECLQTVSKELVSHFAPMFVYQELDVEKPLGKGYKEEFKEARELVENDDLSGAFSILKEVYDADPYDAAMAHNMGVIYEAVGNFDQAITYHKAAYEVDDSKDHKAALERTLNSKEALDELGRLGADITPFQFDPDAKERLNIVKVTTKGKKTDRYDVYMEANKGSDVAAKVPGDTDFVMLGEEGSWYKIKLLGGKEGYISKTVLDIKK